MTVPFRKCYLLSFGVTAPDGSRLMHIDQAIWTRQARPACIGQCWTRPSELEMNDPSIARLPLHSIDPSHRQLRPRRGRLVKRSNWLVSEKSESWRSTISCLLIVLASRHHFIVCRSAGPTHAVVNYLETTVRSYRVFDVSSLRDDLMGVLHAPTDHESPTIFALNFYAHFIR